MPIYPSTEIISLEIRKRRNFRRHFHGPPQPVGYYKGNFRRLAMAKAQIDPTDYFRSERAGRRCSRH
jgi:hypothetical protein